MGNCTKKYFIVLTCLFLIGCSTRQLPHPTRETSSQAGGIQHQPPGEATPQADTMEKNKVLYPPEPEETIQRPTPRDIACLKLIKQAVSFLDEKKPDDTIRVLEQALTISSEKGENYYYLAEAWYMKGDLSQAKEYNFQAAIYLKDDTEWMERVEEQKIRINGSN